MTANNHLVPIAAVPTGVEGFGREEGRANARLIAAAPELLEALRAIRSDGCMIAADVTNYRLVEEALARATGGAS